MPHVIFLATTLTPGAYNVQYVSGVHAVACTYSTCRRGWRRRGVDSIKDVYSYRPDFFRAPTDRFYAFP